MTTSFSVDVPLVEDQRTWPHAGVGFDPGNVAVKGAYRWRVGGKTFEERYVTFPSVTTRGSLHALVQARTARGEERPVSPYGILEPDEDVLEVEGEAGLPVYVGALAMREDQQATSGRQDRARYWDRRMLHLLLVTLAKLVPSGTHAHVVTSLPGGVFSPEAIAKVEQLLQGNWTFRLNGEPYTYRVTVEKVLREGAAASLALADKGIPGLQGYIDVGGYTTDLFALSYNATTGKYETAAQRCTSVEAGTEYVADYVNAQLAETYGAGLELSAAQRWDLLHAYGDPARRFPYPELFYRGTPIERARIARWTHAGVQEVARRITRAIALTWPSGSMGEAGALLSKISLIGGGDHAFYDELKTFLPGLVQVTNPQQRNAEGNALLACRLAERAQIEEEAF